MILDPTTPTKEINRRLLLTLHQDGLLDILAGLIVATFGLIPILDETGMGAGSRQIIILLIYGLSVFVIFRMKHRITLPRSGYVKLARKTRSRMSLILLLVNVLLFLLFAGSYVFDIPFWESFGSYQMSVPLGLIFLILFSVTGALLKASRFYLFGLFVMVSFVGAEHLFLRGQAVHHGIPLAAFLSGGLIVLAGCVYLFKFIRSYSAEYH